MSEDRAREGERCVECGTPLEVAEVNDDADPSAGATLVLRCPDGHARTVHRHREATAAEG